LDLLRGRTEKGGKPYMANCGRRGVYLAKTDLFQEKKGLKLHARKPPRSGPKRQEEECKKSEERKASMDDYQHEGRKDGN